MSRFLKTNTSSRSARAFLMGSAALAMMAAAGGAMAQTANSDDQAVEEVVVTGSSIRGVAPVG